jgi:hypothetical protein
LRQKRDEARDLVVRQDALRGNPWQTLGGHAVAAPDVAPIGDRDTKVFDKAAVTIDQRFATALRREHGHQLDGYAKRWL